MTECGGVLWRVVPIFSLRKKGGETLLCEENWGGPGADV